MYINRASVPATYAHTVAGRWGCAGWLTLEILLSIALCVTVMASGTIAVMQIMGYTDGLYPRNQLQQVELARMWLNIESDFYDAGRVYVTNTRLLKSGSVPTSATHSATYTQGDLNTWQLSIAPDDGSAFILSWIANDGTITQTASDTDNKYYTLIFLGGQNKINALVYLTCQQVGSDLRYTLERYVSDGTKLLADQTFSFSAPGMTLAANDQSDTGALPAFTASGSVWAGVVLRPPSAFNKSLRDALTGKQARRVKYSADSWGSWTIRADNLGRWQPL